jgi:hypothetical protein
VSQSATAEISNVAEMLAAAKKLAARAEKHSHIRCWFRGQSKAEWPLQPRVYRDRPDNQSSQPIDEENRKEILATERQFVRDFRHLSASIRTGDESDAMLYVMQQHYGAATRLLDWTTNPLIALYFACQNDESEGKWFAMDAYQMITQNEGSVQAGIATVRHNSFKMLMQQICDWDNKVPALPTKTFPLSPEHFDRRISLQQGVFTFHVPDEPILREGSLVKAYLVPQKEKDRIRKELAAVNINHFTVFGDCSALCRYLNERHGFRS